MCGYNAHTVFSFLCEAETLGVRANMELLSHPKPVRLEYHRLFR